MNVITEPVHESALDIDLIQKYSIAGPRYTSYPPATQFKSDLENSQLEAVMREDNGPDAGPISLYFHLPFCESLCWYCGCNTVITTQRDEAAKYLDDIEKEVVLVASKINPKRKVTQIHFGGGTPTFLPPEQLRRLGAMIRKYFTLSSEVEFGVEIDPRRLTKNNPSTEKNKSHIYHRGVLIAHKANGLKIKNLTIHNTTPHGGSQSEAIILNGTLTAQAVLQDLDLYSFQDTLQVNGQAYITGCHIEGDVDFMWGTGPCYFKDCTCVSLRSDAYYTQVRNPSTNHGYVFVGCQFIGSSRVSGNYLSRIEANRFPYSEVVLLNCTLGDAVSPIGWQLQAKGDTSNLHFWEYNSLKSTKNVPVDTSKRLKVSKQLKLPADKALIESYLDPVFVLGNGWSPKL